MDEKYLNHLLHEYLDGEMSPVDSAFFEELLEENAELAQRLHTLAKVRTLLAGLPREQMKDDFSSKILKTAADGHDPQANSPAIPEGTITPEPGAERAALQKMLQKPRRFSLEWMTLVATCVCLLVVLGVVCQVYFPYQEMVSTHLETGDTSNKTPAKTPEKPESAVLGESTVQDESAGRPESEPPVDNLRMLDEAAPASGEAVMIDDFNMQAGYGDDEFDDDNIMVYGGAFKLESEENRTSDENAESEDTAFEAEPANGRSSSRARLGMEYEVKPKMATPAAAPAAPAEIAAEKTVESPAAISRQDAYPTRLHAPATDAFMAPPATPAAAPPVAAPELMQPQVVTHGLPEATVGGRLNLDEDRESLSAQPEFAPVPGTFAGERRDFSRGAGMKTGRMEASQAKERKRSVLEMGGDAAPMLSEEAAPMLPEEELAKIDASNAVMDEKLKKQETVSEPDVSGLMVDGRALENGVTASSFMPSQRVTVEVQPVAGVSLNVLQAEITSQLQSQVVRVRDLREILKTWQSAGKIEDYRVTEIAPADSAVQARAAMATSRVFAAEEAAEDVDAAVMMDVEVSEERE